MPARHSIRPALPLFPVLMRAVPACVALACALPVAADVVPLTNGLELDGEPIERPGLTLGLARERRRPGGGVYPLYSVEDVVRRYYMPRGMVDRDGVVVDDQIGQIRFELDQHVRASDFEPESIGFVNQSAPFNSDGRRRISVTTNKGPVELIQGPTLVTPKMVEVTTTNFEWTYGLLTHELTDDSLLALLGKGLSGTDKVDQMRRVQFLIQAGRFELARSELMSLREQHPDLASQIARFEEELPKLYGRKAMREIRRLRDAGRHKAVQAYCRTLTNESVGTATMADAEAILSEYDALLARRDSAVFSLATLEADLPSDLATAVRPLRNVIEDELHPASIERLGPFLKVADVEGIDPAAKLALAYSGWVVGPSMAVEDLSHAVQLWKFRDAALHVLGSDNPYVFRDRVDEILAIEGVTASEAAAAMPLLPPVRATGDASGGRLSLVAADGTPYLVQLPPEYGPAHAYPAILALHGIGMEPEDELNWWLGGEGPLALAAKRGVILIAPAYRGRVEPSPGDVEARVMAVLRDARSRFRIDSDRVVLGGHFAGGDCVFDVGFCRPDVWAGLVSIGGRCSPLASKAVSNAEGLPIYAVVGGFDKQTFDANARPLDSLMIQKNPVILCEYINRGRESFRGELERIYDWLLVQRRMPLTPEVRRTVYTDCPQDNGLLRLPAVPARPGKLPPPQVVSARLTPSNRLYVDTGGRSAEVWLTGSIVEYGERMPIEFGSRHLPSITPEPSTEVVLQDFNARFDRERVFTQKVVFE